MFFLLSFVFAKNYCIERQSGKCKEICKSLPENLDGTLDYIPYYSKLNISKDEMYNFYITEEMGYNRYMDPEYNFNYIFCDPSIHLTSDIENTIRIGDHIYIDSQQMRDDIPFIFDFTKGINIEIDTEKMPELHPVILQSLKQANDVNLRFFVPNIPENLILISSKSYNLKLIEKTDRIEKLFNDTNKIEIRENMSYYCISDKDEYKCPGYNYPSMKYVSSSFEISSVCSYIIVDSSMPQIFDIYKFAHIIGLAGTDITIIPSNDWSRPKYQYIILHSNCIEMDNFVYEGEGNITISTLTNISFISTSKTNNFHLTLKTEQPLDFDSSFIFPIHDDDFFDFDNKINVPDYSMYIGPKKFNGMFEKGKFLTDEDFKCVNLTADELKECDFDNVNYYFKGGDVEIPVTWRKNSFMSGNSFADTNLIFNDVYSFDNAFIDNFIDVSIYDKNIYHNITIKPAKYFSFSTSGQLYNGYEIIKTTVLTILIDKEVYMYVGDINYLYFKHICIKGKGTIIFYDYSSYKLVKNDCTIDETINLVYSNSTFETRKVYACVGQSDLNKCKSKISDIDSLNDYEWIWLRNFDTAYVVCPCIKIEEIFFTDKLIKIETQRYYMHHYYPHYYYPYNNITLTPDADLTIISSGISVSKDHINNIYAGEKTSKLTCILYNYTINYLADIKIDYIEPPTDIDFTAYLYNDNVKLKMKYLKDFVPNSIKIDGKSKLYVRDYMMPITDIFQKSDSIMYMVNYFNDHEQICFSEKPIEDDNLYDCFLTSKYDDFAEYANISKVPAYIYSDINLKFYSDIINFKCVTFFICDNITAKFDVPNDVLLVLFNFSFNITLDKYYCFNNRNQQSKLVFNVNDYITLDTIDNITDLPTIELSGPEHSVDVFLFPSLRKFDQNYIINVHENLTINSPYPPHISHLFGKTPVNFSPRWSYLYLSEEGKKFYQSNSLNTYSVIDNDENLEKNIVLAVGKDDIFSIPANWKNPHNIYIVQEDYTFYINKPTSVSYQKDGLLLNDNVLIISGKAIIYSSDFYNLNIDFSKGPSFHHFPYEANIDCSLNKKTDLYVIYINDTYFDPQKILIYNYSDTNSLVIHMNSQDKWRKLRKNVDFYSEDSFELLFSFNGICYYKNYYHRKGNCSENSLMVSSNSDLNKAIFENPLLPVVFGDSIILPFTYGPYLVLNQKDPNIRIDLPSSPISMSVLENKTVRFGYKDSKIIDVINKSRIFVELFDTIDLDIKAAPNSTITFELGSNVLVTTQSQINYDFRIFIYNYYLKSLYAENLDMFGNIFGDILKQYNKVCAHDSDSISYCTLDKKEIIWDVFSGSDRYNEIEVALSHPAIVNLPWYSIVTKVNILPTESSTSELNVRYPKNIFISPENIVLNQNWVFEGNTKILCYSLDKTASISITGSTNGPILFEINSFMTTIYLIKCDMQESQTISINRYDSDTRYLMIYGTLKSFNNFKNSLFKYNNIVLIHDATQRTICLCSDTESCSRCRYGTSGIVADEWSITTEPGEDVDIRVFYPGVKLTSTVFTNEHNVYIGVNCSLILNDVDTVDQNIVGGIKFDNLVFRNETYDNLIIRPKSQGLNIFMNKNRAGQSFTVKVDRYLKLNVINANDKNIVPSKLHAIGYGELNVFDYPIRYITSSYYVRVVKGVYKVCYDGLCDKYQNEGYRTLGTYNNFTYNFDPNAKIIVYLSTFNKSIDANLNNLKGQKIEFDNNVTNSSLKILESQNKLRFTTTTELVNKNDSTTELSNSIGGALLDNSESDMFIVGFDEKLTIKQEGNISSEIKQITIQPMNDQVSIFIDESVDVEKQKIKIETENDKEVQVKILTNNNVANDELLKNFIEINENKVKVTFGDSMPNEPKKKGLPIGGIIGIVIGVIVIVAVIVVVVLFLMKNKSKNNNHIKNNTPSLSSDSNDQLEDSTF